MNLPYHRLTSLTFSYVSDVLYVNVTKQVPRISENEAETELVAETIKL